MADSWCESGSPRGMAVAAMSECGRLPGLPRAEVALGSGCVPWGDFPPELLCEGQAPVNAADQDPGRDLRHSGLAGGLLHACLRAHQPSAGRRSLRTCAGASATREAGAPGQNGQAGGFSSSWHRYQVLEVHPQMASLLRPWGLLAACKQPITPPVCSWVHVPKSHVPLGSVPLGPGCP